MARVAVVFTGGTISMGFDPVAGGNVPSLDGAAILERTPGLDAFADVVAIDRGLTPASHFTFRDLMTLRGVIAGALDDEGIDGVVVVQGTDTIEETAFAWDLTLETSKPVVVTGAMRASHEEDYDGPANLRRSVAAAASTALSDAGVVVSLAGTLEAADDVTKMHTRAFDTFRSPNRGSFALVDDDGSVRVGTPRGPRRRLRPVPTDGARVELVQAGIGSDGAMIDAAVSTGARGIVVAATGAGNTSKGLLDAAERAMNEDVVVVLASRCPAGAVSDAYAFPGGGATWIRAGALPVGTLCAIKARVALALGLGAGLGRDPLADLLADPVG
ncbi:MAG TPA: asparaginase [Candidatus Limnocylindrales bacterium]|nr:asparaginase [Candidatus Limnocylindrales bacterium]